MNKFRIYLLLGGMMFFSLLLGGRLFFIQVVNADLYLSKAEDQYVNKNYHLYNRGEIYFRNKDGDLISAATIKSGYFIQINQDHIMDPDLVFENLNSVVEVDESNFNKAMEGANNIAIASNINQEEAEKIREMNLQGVTLHSQRWRFYPGNRVASHVLGLVSFEGHNKKGSYGLERYYEDVLNRPDSQYQVNLFAKIFDNKTKDQMDVNDQEGDIITTIEPMIQSILEEELRGIQDKWKSRSIGGIIINPNTGEVKSMALLPNFDPNDFSSESSVSVFSNLLVEGVYEMGSVVKPLTIAAGLDSGVVEPDSTYFDPGSIQIDGYTISNFDGRGYGEVTMQEVLNRSVNTGVVHVMDEMGTDVFSDYIRGFGLDSKTEIDLPSEANNIIRNFDSPRRVEFATASFGQGVAFPPIAMTRALGVLANGGYLVDPYLVEGIQKKDGEIIKVNNGDRDKERVISEDTSKKISRMLVNTVDEALLEGTVSLPRYNVAAKTGTAQIPYEDRRGYRDDAFLHSFFGYFPAYDPEFLIFLYHIEPQGAQYASQTLTESFMNIVNFLIQYNNISPDR